MISATSNEERIAFARFSDMPFAEVMSVDHTRRHFSVFHETYSFCTNITAGGGEWLYRGRKERGLGNIVMLLEPGETHRVVKLLGGTGCFRVLHLQPQWVTAMAEEAGMSHLPHFGRSVLDHPAAHDAAVAFHHCIENGATALERETRLTQLLAELLQHTEKPPRTPPAEGRSPALCRARDYLVEHHDQKMRLDDLAGIAGMTKFHFVRSFARAFGLTPHAFLNHVRVSAARRLLRASQPAADCGAAFFDQSHFTRVFHRVMGVTPARYAGAEKRRSRRPERPIQSAVQAAA